MRLALIAVAILCSCTSWQTQALPSRHTITDRSLGRVRMLQTDRRSVVLDTARVVGDTLIGVVSEPRHASSPSRRVAVPLSQVLELQVRKADSLRTAAVIAAVLLLIGGVTFALAFGQGLWEWYGEIAEAED